MIGGPALENLVAAVAECCRAGVELDELRARVLPRLRRAVPFDAVWWAAVDPASLLFTRAYGEEIPAESGPYFVENEFLADDVNKWTQLARDPRGVRTLVEATAGEPARSERYREIFRPLGLEDELRAVLCSGDVCWGYLCLHRQGPAGFSAEEARFLRRVAPLIGEGIRLGLLIGSSELEGLAEAPGLVLLAADGSLLATNTAAEQWLDEVREPNTHGLPLELHALAARLRASANTATTHPRLRVRTRAGRFALLHASLLDSPPGAVAVIIEQAAPLELAPLVMAAYGLTPRERTVTGLVCQGLSTKQIASRLSLSANTVQDHLKSIFSKTGVRSRRELVVAILRQEYLPRAHARQRLGPRGFFASP